jgi:hypothetical protein
MSTFTSVEYLVPLFTTLKQGIRSLKKNTSSEDSEGFTEISTPATTIVPSEWNWDTMSTATRVFVIMLIILMIVPAIIVFVRLVYMAFKVQGPLQGIFSFISPQLYIGWNFASLIQKNFENTGFAGFFKN